MTFSEKKLTKSLNEDLDNDWFPGHNSFNEETADESSDVKLAVLSHLIIFHRIYDSPAIWWMNSWKLIVLTWWIVKFCWCWIDNKLSESCHSQRVSQWLMIALDISGNHQKWFLEIRCCSQSCCLDREEMKFMTYCT